MRSTLSLSHLWTEQSGLLVVTNGKSPWSITCCQLAYIILHETFNSEINFFLPSHSQIFPLVPCVSLSNKVLEIKMPYRTKLCEKILVYIQVPWEMKTNWCHQPPTNVTYFPWFVLASWLHQFFFVLSVRKRNTPQPCLILEVQHPTEEKGCFADKLRGGTSTH